MTQKAGKPTTGDQVDNVRLVGKIQILEVSVTAAANAGADTVLATIVAQPCLIESIVVHADAGQTGDLTSCPVYGGTGKVVTFVGPAVAVQAALDAADKQVAWTGAVRFAAGETLVMEHNGTGATALDLTVTISYRACVLGGYLS